MSPHSHFSAVEFVWRGEEHDHRQPRAHILVAWLRESPSLSVGVQFNAANVHRLVGIAPFARLRAHARHESLLELTKVRAEMAASVQVQCNVVLCVCHIAREAAQRLARLASVLACFCRSMRWRSLRGRSLTALRDVLDSENISYDARRCALRRVETIPAGLLRLGRSQAAGTCMLARSAQVGIKSRHGDASSVVRCYLVLAVHNILRVGRGSDHILNTRRSSPPHPQDRSLSPHKIVGNMWLNGEMRNLPDIPPRFTP